MNRGGTRRRVSSFGQLDGFSHGWAHTSVQGAQGPGSPQVSRPFSPSAVGDEPCIEDPFGETKQIGDAFTIPSPRTAGWLP